MDIKSEKTFEEIVERLVALFKPERRLHAGGDDHRIHSFWQDPNATTSAPAGHRHDDSGTTATPADIKKASHPPSS